MSDPTGTAAPLFALKYSPRELLEAIVATRRHLNRYGHTRKPLAGVSASLRAVAPWVDAYPRASHENCIRFMARNYIQLMKLIPGDGHPAGPAYRRHLEYYIATQKPKQ